jgi:hypothetical protein
MELSGQWNPDADKVFYHIAMIGTELEKGADKMPCGPVRDASSAMYSNLSAVSGTLLKICKDTTTPCSSQAVGSLLRSVIDSTISVFAFCHDPQNRAIMYLQYKAVLNWMHVERVIKNIGCPLLPASQHEAREVEIAREMAGRDLWIMGVQFLTQKVPSGRQPAEFLREAVKNSSARANWFRQHWWSEKRRSDVLAYEQMAWVDDVLYKWLCSCVHPDVCAGKPLAGLKRDSAAMLALQFWGSSVLRLSQALGVDIGADNARFLENTLYKRLQWAPAR